MCKKIILCFSLIVTISSQAQILGGGALFSNAVTFNQSWILSCPASGTTLSNQPAFEPTTAMDPCAPAPGCATGTTGSDVWFSFFARSTTASIVVNPSASFDIAIQAFSGTSCPGLTDMGCVDVGGNNATETLNLTGLTVNTIYYFRIFGATNSVANRTGTYTFCGSAGLGSTILPVEIISFRAVEQNNKVILNWATASESNNSYFEIERSINGNQYQPIGRVAGIGTTSQTTHYSFTDFAPFITTNYYRLKQMDIDGRYKYSAILAIRFDKKLKKNVTISPNPVSDKINIRISSDAATNGGIRVINASGQTIYQQSERLVIGENLFTINSLQNLSKGICTVQVLIDDDIFAIKFISIK
jgi:Secretion system C-terminal sorting domain